MRDLPTLLGLLGALQSSVLKKKFQDPFPCVQSEINPIRQPQLSLLCGRDGQPFPHTHTYDAGLSEACNLVENYSSYLLTICPEHMPSTMLGLSHLSSFITHHERDGIIHFSDDGTQAHCK